MTHGWIDPNTLTEMANGIRKKNGTEEQYLPSQMPEAILNLNNLVCDPNVAAFLGHTGTTFTFPDGVFKIADQTFAGWSTLEEVEIPEGVESIGASAFKNCTNLSSVKFPNSLTSIGDRAFYEANITGCLTIPKNVAQIGAEAFEGCPITQVKSHSFGYNVANVFGKKFETAGPIDGGYDFEYSWTDNDAFASAFLNAGFKELVLTSGTTGINDGALAIPTLETLTLSNTIRSIAHQFSNFAYTDSWGESHTGQYIDLIAFKDLTNLTAMYVTEGNPTLFDRDGILYANSDENEYVTLHYCPRKYSGTVNIANDVDRITDATFRGCKDLRIEIPESVKYPGTAAFTNMNNSTLIFPTHLIEKMHDCYFKGSSSMTITFKGNTLPTFMSSDLFKDCSSLTINVPWAKDEVPGAPWGARPYTTVNYNYTENE